MGEACPRPYVGVGLALHPRDPDERQLELRGGLAGGGAHRLAVALGFSEPLASSGSWDCSSSTVLPGFITLPARPG